MQVTFLGTGTSSGVPMIGCTCEVCRSLDHRDQRLRVSVHVAIEGRSLVIDSGPDFRQQMLRARITHLDALLFTHEHKDHTAGLDDIRAFNFRQQQDMPLFGEPRVLQQLQQEFSYIFAEHKYPGVPRVSLHPIEQDHAPFDVLGLPVQPLRALHHKLPVLGFRIGGFCYLTDANHIGPETMALLHDADVIVLNALRREQHISHFTLAQAIEILEVVKPKRAYLTHISHQLGRHQDVEAELPPWLRLAYDGLKVEV
ncbi:MBL fold metallo-hydrolase [Hymenobacter sp. BT770]|uniref:MBL fold metallo-hydrolase n=1 Tax=Hymenobacter sp. BT770 TaxID=2886942 RepID=UPI001D1001BE|nr:MBL fold metallo-hydrolase [Hymenobacter sp. BT770]MCC3152060.1 MBL fold metallo-hydrolase [Hymenobacter sp. BT770]MDO3415257.1 MBL fold metallo-hydrolase [Hymenobacter sp. BT770]